MTLMEGGKICYQGNKQIKIAEIQISGEGAESISGIPQLPLKIIEKNSVPMPNLNKNSFWHT